jgi:ATP-dependent exoDNAse (exonuclease V) alpha subunit
MVSVLASSYLGNMVSNSPRLSAFVERFGWTFCPGDKVVQVVNDYDRDVLNGDLGVVSAIDPDESELRVPRDNQGERRIASPEMLPGADPLPHLKCSPPGSTGGGRHEADKHGNA